MWSGIAAVLHHVICAKLRRNAAGAPAVARATLRRIADVFAPAIRDDQDLSRGHWRIAETLQRRSCEVMRHPFRTTAARIAATVAPALMPAEQGNPSTRTGDHQTDWSIDAMAEQLPSICRQNGGLSYVVYDYDDNDALTSGTINCFGQNGSWGPNWSCCVDHTGYWLRSP